MKFNHRNGEEADHFTILESLGGGVGLFDFDGDGLLDIFVAGGGYFNGPDKTTIMGNPCKLYRNLGNWKFEDVTAKAGLDRPWFYTQGVAVADYDRDGWPDLLVTGYGKFVLFHNEPDAEGGRRFVDATEKLGLRDDLWSTSAGWGDIDGDGYPDLYVCHYADWSFANNPHCRGSMITVKQDVCTPSRFKPLVHSLFRNVKGTLFRNVSAEHGFKAEGYGLGVVFADLNDDGRPDIYVANDTTANFLFWNRGGKLVENGVLSGTAFNELGKPDGSMGVDAGDYDGSGRPAIWVTNFQGELHALYSNLGKELFQHHSIAAGTAAIGRQFVGFGTGFIDVDNDGWLDLFVANGHVWRYPASGTPKQRPVLLGNGQYEGRRFFTDISDRGGDYFKTLALGRGVAIGDLDNDGWPDIVISHNNGPLTLLRNVAAAETQNRWLGLKLVGKQNRDLVGSTVIVESNGRTLTRLVKGGGSYLSANDPRIVVGLEKADRVDRVTVKWSWGENQSWANIEPNRYWELREGEGAPKEVRVPVR